MDEDGGRRDGVGRLETLDPARIDGVRARSEERCHAIAAAVRVVCRAENAAEAQREALGVVVRVAARCGEGEAHGLFVDAVVRDFAGGENRHVGFKSWGWCGSSGS